MALAAPQVQHAALRLSGRGWETLPLPAPEGFADARLSPDAARWDDQLGEYLLDWADVRTAPDPGAAALDFARSAFRHACLVCHWEPAIANSAESKPPPVV